MRAYGRRRWSTIAARQLATADVWGRARNGQHLSSLFMLEAGAPSC